MSGEAKKTSKGKTSKDIPDKKTKAQLNREERDSEKAKVDAEVAAKKKVDKEKKVSDKDKKASEPPKDTRSKAQKDREEREDLKEQKSVAASSAIDFPNSKTKVVKEQNKTALQEGLEIFDELSSQEPEDVTDWFMTQVRKAGKTGKSVESLPLYQFACAINSATDAQRQKIAQAAIAGYGALDAERRAQVLTLVVQSADAAQLNKTSGKESQHVGNLRAIVKAARFDKMPEKEKESLLLTTQAKAMEFATPQHITGALAHMNEDERKELSSALIKTKFVPQDQAALIEELMQADGILDEVSAVSIAAPPARDLIWAAVFLPLLEWICAKRWLKTVDCTSSLVQWLHVDACLSLALVVFALMAFKLLAPAYDILSSDPTGALRRWQSSGIAGDDIDTRLQNTIRIGSLAYRLGFGAAVFAGFLAFASGIYASWAILLLLSTLSDGCLGPSVLFEACVIGLRFAFIAAVLYVVFRVYDLLQRHKFLDSKSMTGASQPGYGSTDETALEEGLKDVRKL